MSSNSTVSRIEGGIVDLFNAAKLPQFVTAKVTDADRQNERLHKIPRKDVSLYFHDTKKFHVQFPIVQAWLTRRGLLRAGDWMSCPFSEDQEREFENN